VPFQLIVEVLLKSVPVAVIVNEALPATIDAGDTELRTGMFGAAL